MAWAPAWVLKDKLAELRHSPLQAGPLTDMPAQLPAAGGTPQLQPLEEPAVPERSVLPPPPPLLWQRPWD